MHPLYASFPQLLCAMSSQHLPLAFPRPYLPWACAALISSRTRCCKEDSSASFFILCSFSLFSASAATIHIGLSDLLYSINFETNSSLSFIRFSRSSRLRFCKSGLNRLKTSPSAGVMLSGIVRHNICDKEMETLRREESGPY